MSTSQSDGTASASPTGRGRRLWPVLAVLVVLVAVAGYAVLRDVLDDGPKPVRLTYEVTGTATGVTIGYSTMSGGNTSTQTEQGAKLPWRKEVDVVGETRGATLTVSAGPEGGTVTCSIRAEGREPRTASAEGPFAVASCSSS
ncbi:hypothetical protein [Streptoalloteichus hindustanus]|uniref:MmpS family membrane protein n=1 Tax=Streptoalloteichus hindustanus TaxID=2017 RepID=A0A1M5H207_STRHI|nr:hypothetical protein [Streptoalloteichus hindustanus]SHG10081.1 hypothetical protein SAMN05444320_106369 [Streptoalloteichus hindustanus]